MGIRAEGVVGVLGTYPDEIDASLQAAYAPRDPLAEVFSGQLTFRGLRVLIDGLPTDSAVVRAFQQSSWRDSDWILHDISSQLRLLNASLTNAFRAEDTQPQKPTFLPTPMSETSVADDRAEAFYAQQRAEMDEIAARMFANN